jgi:outer membrane protein assembly factor BamB
MFLCTLCLCAVAGTAPAAEPWSTYRGNLQRTGNTDGVAVPDNPKALWVVKSQDHFVASPVPAGGKLLLPGLGGFNVSTVYAFPLEPKDLPPKPEWTKSAPYLQQPAVSSPAVLGDKIVFGDGMHQSEGKASLHCITATGLPVWSFPVSGSLVHLEGAATLDVGKAFMGAGSGGVLCVELDKATLDGKEMPLADVQKLVAGKWQELKDKYEATKKTDPFATPPTEDQLPRAAPKKAWQAGADKWHVDSPVAVAGDKVLACSSFLDKEKVGERGLFCLDAGTGEVKWKQPLPLNPWGGPSVADGLAVVGCSTVGYYYKDIKGAKGAVAAFDLATGTPKWAKDVQGGVVGSVALADGAAIATATDGKVRAFELADGNRRWVYDAKAPFFAAPAVVGGVVVAADLAGVVHAIDLKSGTAKWTFDLAKDEAVKAPGMVYAGPVAHAGRLYVTTCNLEGPNARKPTVIVCLGAK